MNHNNYIITRIKFAFLDILFVKQSATNCRSWHTLHPPSYRSNVCVSATDDVEISASAHDSSV